jgi:PAS domain S-box-containing protein
MASRQVTGRPLDTLCGTPVETGRFLRLAAGIAAALAELHGREIIHRNIEPRNILIDPETSAVMFTGFSSTPLLPQEYPAGTSYRNIEVTPAYMSPEQTGRMNRAVDYRTDLYSLGVTFYEMLTGALPFRAGDILEWAHCHIARTPRSPTELVPEIPTMLSEIVTKLLAKNSEERYQTASGLQYDLEKCLEQWEAWQEIQPFPLGERDISDRLLIPQKLYGRERDINTLLGAFERVIESGTPEMVMVAGYSGIGKTSLVRELYGPVVRERGYFISGKFDQYKREIPYSTFAEAFREMIRQILTENEERVAEWKRRIQEALGINGQLILDIIPQAELIIGPQPPVPELPATETQNRFNMFFRQFVSVFARKEHPLVIFLDDLQWVDSAGLKLLEYVITHPDTQYLLLIGAYRDNEVGSSHPLISTLDNIRKHQAILRTITLSPLSFADLGRLMADTFRADRRRVEPLARLVHEKTAGNPFFVIHFLKTLKDEGLVEFDRLKRLWKWDIARIKAKGYTDNLVDLMVGKLKKLSTGTLRELTLAACIGNGFDFHTLALISGISEVETLGLLQEALREGLVLQATETSFNFLHDRVQEAAYSLVPETQRAELCLRIGRLLLANTPEERLEESIFDIVSHFNSAGELIRSREECERVAELNLIAGKRARKSSAYRSALKYFTAGSALLPEDSWNRRYDLTFVLRLYRAECEFLTGDLERAEHRLSMLRRRAGNLVDGAAVACLQVLLYTVRDRSDRAVNAGLQFLKRVGVQWSAHPTEEEVRGEYEPLWRQLGSRSVEELIDLPPMTDPEWRATMDVLTMLSSPALFTDENLLCLIVGRMANLSLEYGNSDGSCLGYVRLGMVLGPHFGHYREGFRFGRLGFDLVEKRGLVRFKARTYLGFGHLVNPWTRHMRGGIELVRRAFEAARETGDLTYASYSSNCLITLLLASGDQLGEVHREAERALAFVLKARFGLVTDIITGQLRFIRTLRGLTPDFSSFNDAEFDERRFEQHLEGDPRLAIANCWYWIRKLQARFHAGDFASSLEAAAKARPLLWTSVSFFEVAEYHFYAGLALAARCDSASPDERARHLETLADHKKQIALWAENCPENFLNRYALVSAEAARLEGRELEAEQLYEEAIRSARDNGFVQNEAIAFELAAGFYRARGFETTADAYLRHARACYIRWGADGKVKQLDEQFTRLLEEEKAVIGGGITARLGRVDAITVVKASQAISGEILLSKLLDTLMRIVLENAGAEKGYLLLARGEELSIGAQAGVEGEEIKVLLEAPSRMASVLPESVVNYVRRTRESVILDDASADKVFSPDEYVMRNKPVSVLCLPVLRHADLIGVLYLENNIVKGAFTPERIAVLEALAAQAAISLENSTLYAALDESRRLQQSIIDNSTAVIYVKDLDGRYLLVNRRFEELFHVTREAVAGKTDFDLFPKARADAFRAFDREVLVAGRVLEAEEEVPQDDGLHTYISIKAPLFDVTGTVYAVCGISADISERYRAQEALQKAHEELEQKVVERTRDLSEANVKLQELDRLKSMFIASMSHELRTPLNSVIGFSSILLNEWGGPLNEEQKENLAVILRSGKHLLALINDVIDVSKIEAGKIESVIEEFDINDLIVEAVDLISRDAEGKGLDLKVEAIRLTMNTDRRRLLQCVINLLSNAVKFTEEGYVRIVVRRVNDMAEILVEDTGIGIRENEMPKLFQPFVRLVSPRKAIVPGTGLGLYLTGRLVREVLKGDIMCESAYGKGSIFTLRIPVMIK